ncbi:MAG: MFS transporter [Dehalococcoidales bacterium]|nr:MFS transporter [Dehalococcoidales bacterium]
MRPQPASAVVKAGARFHYAYVVVLLASLTMLGAQGFLRFGYAMILPSLRADLGLTFTQTGMLATVHYVGYTLAAISLGWVVFRFGYRHTITFGTVTVGLAMILFGLAPNYETALVLMAIAGACGLVSTSPAIALATAWFVRQRRGRAMGAISAGGPVGSLITGLLIPPLIVALGVVGWRYGWSVLGVAVVLFGVLDAFFLRNRPADLGLLPFGATSETEREYEPERVDLGKVYRSPTVWYLAVLGMASALSNISFVTFFTAYLLEQRGFTAEGAGQLWALSGVIGIASGFMWGGISDRVGRQLALIVVYAIQAVSFGLFAWGGSPWVFLLCTFLYGLTARANIALMAAFCGDLLGPQLAAASFGVNNILGGVGLGLGPALAGYIADTTNSFTPAFWGSAVVALLGALGSALLREQPHSRSGQSVR